MKWLNKVKRILLKTLLYSVILLFFSTILLCVIGQTETFQTWAAKRVTNYLSSELGVKLEVKRVKISFIKNVMLEGVFLSDQHNDTLLFGKSIQLNVNAFDYQKQQLDLSELALSDLKVKMIHYKNEPDFNFQFLVDYFSSDSTSQTDSSQHWKINYGALKLTNVDFRYQYLPTDLKVSPQMNYDNLHLTNVSGLFTHIDFRNDTIFSDITHLSAKEQCGIHIKDFTTKASISATHLQCDSVYLKTDYSLVKGTVSFKYDTWDDYTDFINKVYMKLDLKDSTSVNMKDIAYFAEDIQGFKEVFGIKGKVKGFVNDLNGSDLDVRYGKHTQFVGDFAISGLPDINQSFIHFNTPRLAFTKEDIEQFPIPPFQNPTHLKLPHELSMLGIVTYKGKFDGFLTNFATYGQFNSNIGSLRTDLQITRNLKSKQIDYSGSFSTTSLNISKLVPNYGFIGPVSLSAKINGHGVTADEIDVVMDGAIQSITYNNYAYNQLKIDGSFKKRVFTGSVVSRDPNADFDFNGTIDVNHKVPKMDFISTIHNFDLEKTHFSNSKLHGKLSSQLFINLNGDDLDNLSGQINLDNTVYKQDSKVYRLNKFNLYFDQSQISKSIRLNSTIVNAQLSGKYQLSKLPKAFNQYLNTYFPTVFKTNTRYIYSDKADLSITIKNFTMIKDLFLNDVMISPNTQIDASFDAAINYLYIKSSNNLVNYAGVKFQNNNLVVNSLPKGISLQYQTNKIALNDSLTFKNGLINLVANDKTSGFELTWNNDSKPLYSGNLKGQVLFGATQANILLDKVKIVVADSVWQLVKPNPITMDSSFHIKVNPISFYNNNQLITIDGTLSKDDDDKCDVFIQNVKLSQLNPLLAGANFSIDGSLTGNISLYSAFNKQIVNSNIDFSEFKLNNKLIGSGELHSEYNPDKEYVSIRGFSSFGKDFDGNLMKNIDFSGFYYTKKEDDNLDISFKAEPFDLSLLQPYLKDIITIKVGFLNGTGKITGTPSKPLINADLKIMKCVMLVDYLNVLYTVSGNVNIKPNQIHFDNLELRDKTGNVGSVDGNVFHSNFKNMRIDFDVNTSKLMVLNTTAVNNSSFYGTAYASGNVGVFGFSDDIKMEINMKTNGGTRFVIPLDGPSEMSNNEFIQFVSKDTVKKVKPISKSNISLDFNLEATSDAEVQLIFDEKSGDVIKARGDGNLNMKINSKGKFDMFGDYVLSTGDYLFTLENFVTKKFEIEKGSSIKWNGNVYKANIDIVANYKQRASIKPLFPNDSASNYNKRFPVDCKLYMKDKLTSPDIEFGIELPTIDESTRTLVKNLLVDPNELNRQVFSLLLLRSFVTPIAVTGGSGVNAGGAMAATGSEMLSNKISSWLNGVTKDVDIGVNYRPGDALSSEELDLALSKQLFNNRLTIDGNLGVNNNNSANTKTTNNSNLIGDVTVELKLTESGKYRVKGFNRSNDNTQVLNSGGPFTQGVGIFYREEFESLNELYRRYLGKVKKK